jgi:Tol biopolymer transport system component
VALAIYGTGEYFAEGPIWSPDGRYLAYRHADCHGSGEPWWDVVISDPPGNVVTTFPSEGWGISWSPDSRRVAVLECWCEEATIGVCGLDGARQALITVPFELRAHNGEGDPVWSSDGESLVLPNAGHIPIDGSTPWRPTWAKGGDGWRTYSPDGSRYAYTTRSSLAVAAADGSDPEHMFGDCPCGSLAWSSTGDRIAFVSFSSTPWFSNGQLRMLDVATGTVTSLAESEGSEFLSVIAGAAFEFSPQGDRILFSKTEDEGAGASSLWSVNADGSDLRPLVAGTALGDWLTLSPTP